MGRLDGHRARRAWAKASLGAAPVFGLAFMLWCASRITSFRKLLSTGAAECSALINTMTDAKLVKPAATVTAVRAMRPT